MGRANWRRDAGAGCAARAALSARSRCAAAERRLAAAPMIDLLSRLFGRSLPAYSEARPADAAVIANLHGKSFQRGWGDDEVYRLLIDGNVVAHRASSGRQVVGFILSRRAASEAEILSVAVAPEWRGRKISRPLLDLHLRRLAGLGIRTVFL